MIEARNDDAAVAQLQQWLSRSPYPSNLKERLLADGCGGREYRRVLGTDAIPYLRANSSYLGHTFGCCFCRLTTLVQDGMLGMLQDDDKYFFLGPGYHSYTKFGCSLGEQVPIATVNRPVAYGPIGFVTVTEGNIGVMLVAAEYKLLAPGTYTWNCPALQYVETVNVAVNTARLGPYTMIAVPNGDVAVTFKNGALVVLGDVSEPAGASAGCNPIAGGREFFLDDPQWRLATFLSTQTQTDRLEGNDLLSKDNVELVMVAMSEWRIVDPHLAVEKCASTMGDIRTKVNSLVRATIARIVGGTNIGAGHPSTVGHVANPIPVAVAVGVDNNGNDRPQDNSGDATLASLMQSAAATKHMAELVHHTTEMGIAVAGVYVPEKRMKNDDIRQEVAKQAVIGIKAEADRSAADAKAYATIRAANAEAEAIETLAQAHATAGQRLGAPTDTAARLALSEVTAKALSGARVTVFSGAPDKMPFMLNSS